MSPRVHSATCDQRATECICWSDTECVCQVFKAPYDDSAWFSHWAECSSVAPWIRAWALKRLDTAGAAGDTQTSLAREEAP